MSDVSESTLSALTVSKHVEIHATSERVFTALSEEIDMWWGEPYLRDKKAKALHLEAKLGGKFFESWEDGGMILGEVIEIKKNERLYLRGPMGIEGLILGVVKIDLKQVGTKTQLDLEHSMMGILPEHVREGFNQGWDNLIKLRLKAWLEKGRKYGLGFPPPLGTPEI